MCSIADTSMPFGSCVRHVSRARPRTWRTNAIAPARSANGTNARHIAGLTGSTRSVASVTTPRVPSQPMKRSIEIHPRGGEVAGGQLGGLRHAVAGDRHAGRATSGLDLEVTVGVGVDGAALDVEHAPVRQHDRDGVDPVARRAVLERRRAGGVGGHDAADGGAHEGRRRRVVAARAAQRLVEIGERDAGLDAHRVGADVEDPVEAAGCEHDLAHGRRAARERRLSADGQHWRAAGQRLCDVGLGCRRISGRRRDRRESGRRPRERLCSTSASRWMDSSALAFLGAPRGALERIDQPGMQLY